MPSGAISTSMALTISASRSSMGRSVSEASGMLSARALKLTAMEPLTVMGAVTVWAYITLPPVEPEVNLLCQLEELTPRSA